MYDMQCQQIVDYVSLVYEISQGGRHVLLKGCPYIRALREYYVIILSLSL